MMTDTKVQRDCKHAIYSKSKNGNSDIVFVKEEIIQPDGSRKKNTRLIYNFKREFFITKPIYRKHKQKKDYELASKLQRYVTPQWDLCNAISKRLGQGNTNLKLRQINRSPYVYGADPELPVIIKHEYTKHFPGSAGPKSIAVIDIETWMGGHKEKQIIMASLTFKERVYTFITRDFFKGAVDEHILHGLNEALQKYLGNLDAKDKNGNQITRDIIKERNLTVEFDLVNTAEEGVVNLFKRAHEWQPDVITGWNIFDFDIPKIMETLDTAGVDKERVFCDPSVPSEYRNLYFYPGKSHKVTDSGKVQSLANYEKWPYIDAPASFIWNDSMCAYYYLRTAKGKELNYKLDTIANKIVNVGKMKFSQADGYQYGEWHEFMQDYYPYEYVIYNIFDCIVVEMMDEVTNDLSIAIPTFCGDSEYKNFTSQPKRKAESMEWEVRENGYIWGSTSDKMRDESLDNHLQGLGGWIVMLPTENVEFNGRPMFHDVPNLLSYVRTDTDDIDVEGAYPTGTIIMNVGQQTTWIESCSIQSLDDTEYRQVAVNLASGGRTNAAEISRMVYKLPDSDTLLDGFMREKGISHDEIVNVSYDGA